MKYPAMHWIQIRRDEEWIDLLSCPAENVSEWKRKHNVYKKPRITKAAREEFAELLERKKK